ncbi:MAG: sulfite exporter TauE/SafE family protein [Ilumatobacter sp.]
MDVATALGLLALAFVVGVYGSVIGAGGGFVMVAGLVLLFDLSGATAVGTSVITTAAIQTAGAYTYSKKGLVDRPSALWFVAGSIPVSFATALFLAERIPTDAFEAMIGVLLLTLAAFVVLVPRRDAPEGTTLAPRRAALVGSGSVIGILSGGFGVGAGLVAVPLFGRLQRLSAYRAAATTTLAGACSGFAASVGHTIADNPDWWAIPFTVVGAVAGGRLGASNAGRLSPRTILVLLAGGLVAAGLPLVIGSF